MNKESILTLQKIDSNCNDCKHMVRDFEKFNRYDLLYTNEKGQVTRPSHRLNYGICQNLSKSVSFIPNICQLDTQSCFVHRKDGLPLEKLAKQLDEALKKETKESFTKWVEELQEREKKAEYNSKTDGVIRKDPFNPYLIEDD